jgi:hypothetical protein
MDSCPILFSFIPPAGRKAYPSESGNKSSEIAIVYHLDRAPVQFMTEVGEPSMSGVSGQPRLESPLNLLMPIIKLPRIW